MCQYIAVMMSIHDKEDPRWGVPALCDISITRWRTPLAVFRNQSVSICRSSERDHPLCRLPKSRVHGLHGLDVEIARISLGIGHLASVKRGDQIADRMFDGVLRHP